MGKYAEAGTINRNNQRNNGKTNLRVLTMNMVLRNGMSKLWAQIPC